MNIGSVRLFVYDLAAAHQFYGSTLDLSLVAGGPGFGFCVYQAGAVQLVVESVAQDSPEEDHALVGRFAGISFAVSDAEAAYTRLRELGVRFSEPPERQPWGGVLATFVDPADNQLQLVQSPGSA